jgi:hypothetical protein
MSTTRQAAETQRLSYEEIQPEHSKDFAKLYAIYADLFPLPDEREPPDAFFEISMLNQRADVQMQMGPWREIVAGIRLWQGGPLVGGHVFGVTTSPAHVKFGCRASVQAIYTFLERAARGKGQIPDMKSYMCAEALAKFGFDPVRGGMPPLMFFEVNNPKRMTPQEIEEDTRRSGLDPHRRYIFWKRNGFAPLEFSYVQPRLRPDAEPVRYLDLFCTAGVADAIPAELILAHLSTFVSISVLKGKPAMDDPDFAKMAEALPAGRMVPFVPDDADEQKAILQGARAATQAAPKP